MRKVINISLIIVSKPLSRLQELQGLIQLPKFTEIDAKSSALNRINDTSTEYYNGS